MKANIIKFLNNAGLYNRLRSVIYFPERYNQNILSFYSQFIKKGDLVFDVGANIGQKTDIFLQLGARLIIVEPNPECVVFLQKKYKGHASVAIVPKAVDEKIGSKDFFMNPANALGTMSKAWIDKTRNRQYIKGFQWDKTISVQTTTLEELIQEYGVPQFCKIDVEGHEAQVLKGVRQPLKNVSLEVTPETCEWIAEGVQKLEEWGKMRINFSQGEKYRMIHEWEDSKHVRILLDHIKDKQVCGDLYIQYVE